MPVAVWRYGEMDVLDLRRPELEEEALFGDLATKEPDIWWA